MIIARNGKNTQKMGLTKIEQSAILIKRDNKIIIYYFMGVKGEEPSVKL